MSKPNVKDILAELKRHSSKRNVDGMARYGIVVRNGKIFGVSVGTLRDTAKRDLPSARWIGNDALRDLMKPAVLKKLKTSAAAQ